MTAYDADAGVRREVALITGLPGLPITASRSDVLSERRRQNVPVTEAAVLNSRIRHLSYILRLASRMS